MTYKTLTEAYSAKVDGMVIYATRKLYRKEDAMDVVHDAYVKALEYHEKNRRAVISSFILDRELDRAIRRANKTSVEMPSADPLSEHSEKDNEEIHQP